MLVLSNELLVLSQTCCDLLLVLLIDLLSPDQVVIEMVDLQLETLVFLLELETQLVVCFW